MSIEKIERANGTVWRVRWRDAQGAHAKVLGRKRDAEAFDAELRRMKRTGEIGLVAAGKQTLASFAEEWWKLYAEPNLMRSTLKAYASAWDLHVLPRLGHMPIGQIDVLTVQRLRADLEASGVGPASVHNSLVLLSGILQRGVEWGRLPANPVTSVRKPRQGRQRAVRPLPPADVEALRRELLTRGWLATPRSSPSWPTPACDRARRLLSPGPTSASARC